ncbi:MAG TPA: FtsX-like permease family protein, partial [Longimicrobiales bacterium]|nr:FtsX-like permease family protein [Longimicrobiales bacterium]
DFWQSHFDGRMDVLGQPLRFQEDTYTIIGVAPRGFTGAQLEPFSVWIPLSRRPPATTDWATTWQAQWLRVFGRLGDGVTAEQAGAEATAAFRSAYTGTQDDMKTATVSFRPLHFGPLGKERSETAVARWLVGVSLVVLLIACANVANLLLARAFRRRREVAVRLALGVGRARLARLLLTESVLLALGGGLAALAIAYWGGSFVRLVLLPDVQWADPPLNSRVLVFSAVATLITGLIIGLVPAIQGARQDLVHSLKSGVREGGISRSRLRGTLTVIQAALSVLLLVGGGLFVRSLQAIHGLDLGIEPKRVLTVDIDRERYTFDPATIDGRLAADRIYYRRALERVTRVPGVAQAAVVIGTPFYNDFGVYLKVPGIDSIPDLAGGGPYITAITSDYFAAVGTRLLRGRAFTPSDRENSQPVTIVNQTMAEVLWPNDDAIGKCLIINDEKAPCSSVVGVVEDAHRSSLKEEASFQYYVPLGQESGMGGSMLMVRPIRMDDSGITARIAAALRELDPKVRFIETNTLQEALDPQIRPWRLGATMFTIFGGLALLIAAVGLYSVIAYTVAQRRAELGIRMALGARAVDVVRLVLTQAIILAGAGLLIGAL